MRTLSTAALIEKNKASTSSAWIVLLEIQLDSGTIRLAGNNEDLTWNSQTWQAFPFEIDTVAETGKGEIPAMSVKVSNVTGEIQELLEAVDGGSGTPVIIRVINTAASTGTESEFELALILDRVDYDEQTLNFFLTGNNCLTRRVPRARVLKNFCRFSLNYGGVECGASAATVSTYPTCNGTYDQCVERSNAARFGGFRSMPEL